LSHTVADRFDLWAHILLLKDLLVLDGIVEAIDEGELENSVPEHFKEAVTDDLVSFVMLGLSKSFSLGHIWRFIKPFFVWVMLWFLMVHWLILHGFFLLLWMLWVMFVVGTVMVLALMMMMDPKSLS